MTIQDVFNLNELRRKEFVNAVMIGDSNAFITDTGDVYSIEVIYKTISKKANIRDVEKIYIGKDRTLFTRKSVDGSIVLEDSNGNEKTIPYSSMHTFNGNILLNLRSDGIVVLHNLLNGNISTLGALDSHLISEIILLGDDILYRERDGNTYLYDIDTKSKIMVNCKFKLELVKKYRRLIYRLERRGDFVRTKLLIRIGDDDD